VADGSDNSAKEAKIYPWMRGFDFLTTAWTRVSTNASCRAYCSRIICRSPFLSHMSSTSTNLLGITVYFDSG
jgi:hypothetical protein